MHTTNYTTQNGWKNASRRATPSLSIVHNYVSAFTTNKPDPTPCTVIYSLDVVAVFRHAQDIVWQFTVLHVANCHDKIWSDYFPVYWFWVVHFIDEVCRMYSMTRRDTQLITNADNTKNDAHNLNITKINIKLTNRWFRSQKLTYVRYSDHSGERVSKRLKTLSQSLRRPWQLRVLRTLHCLNAEYLPGDHPIAINHCSTIC